MDFIEYLKSKKIDPDRFKHKHPEQYLEWLQLYEEVHPNNFTQQKLFLINNLRRKYTYEEATKPVAQAATKVIKPKIKPLKPKTK